MNQIGNTPSEIYCSACGAIASAFDRYCGSCGEPLSRLEWRTSTNDPWQRASAKIPVHNGTQVVQVELRNRGRGPLGLVLAERELRYLPAWVQTDVLRPSVLNIPPGVTTMLEVPLDAQRVRDLLAPGSLRGSTDPAKLSFFTSLVEPDANQEGAWRAKLFTITLVLAREPWVSPPGVLYRFIPHELLDGEGLEFDLTLHNESAEPLELQSIEVHDDHGPVFGPPNRLLAEEHIKVLTDRLSTVAPGDQRKDRVAIHRGHGTLPTGRFSGEIRYIYSTGSVKAVVQGVIGPGPTVRVEGSTSRGHDARYEQRHKLELHNPGAVPVRITAMKVLRPDGDPAPKTDWLRVGEDLAGVLLKGGERRDLDYHVLPDERDPGELDLDFGERVIRIEHDGYDADKPLDIEVRARLGRVRTAPGFLGIDFGTTNSMVCMCSPDGKHVASLALDPSISAEHLASLIYYNDVPPPEPSGEFLYGNEAGNAFEVEPANLVRSIKSVLLRGQNREHRFRRKMEGGYSWNQFESQELLNRFIRELKIRAEQAVSTLSPSGREVLGLNWPRVRFERAIFTHPADAGDRIAHALMTAAHECGLNRYVQDLDDFKLQRCIDEATASVLAYVHRRVMGSLTSESPDPDLERVLCFDVGGGTTDVAAVEVEGIEAFKASEGLGTVTVTLLTTAGADFGGDDMDLIVANRILAAIGQESTSRARDQNMEPVAQKELLQALEFRSFSEFFESYAARWSKSSLNAWDHSSGETNAIESHARQLYRKAMEVLNQAERTKRKLSTGESDEPSFSGDRWPLRDRTIGDFSDPFNIALDPQAFDDEVSREITKRLGLLESAVRDAGWTWDQVTTLLFTGQASRTAVLQREVRSFVEAQRGGAHGLVVLAPDDADALDPKRCVSVGAAVWGMSQDQERWIRVNNRMNEGLAFDLTVPVGPFFRKVVERGTSFPAEVKRDFEDKRQELTLYRNGQRYIGFRFPPASKLTICIEGPTSYFVRVDGAMYEGEFLT